MVKKPLREWKSLPCERHHTPVVEPSSIWHHVIRCRFVSIACRVTGQPRATQRHEPAAATPEDPDGALRAWLRQYGKEHPRRGFRPAYHDARSEGWVVNHKEVQRLWREEGLKVREAQSINDCVPRTIAKARRAASSVSGSAV
jgi:hypothetical protein